MKLHRIAHLLLAAWLAGFAVIDWTTDHPVRFAISTALALVNLAAALVGYE